MLLESVQDHEDVKVYPDTCFRVINILDHNIYHIVNYIKTIPGLINARTLALHPNYPLLESLTNIVDNTTSFTKNLKENSREYI